MDLPDVGELNTKERVYPKQPLSILRFPRILDYKPDNALLRKIAADLATQYLKPAKFILPLLPKTMESWGKVRIRDGDYIRTSTTATNVTGRDQSFVRYDLEVDIQADSPEKAPIFETCCFYGQLHKILVCMLPSNGIFGPVPTRRLFAVVQSCQTDGSDATLELVTYTQMRTRMHVIELASISCSIGRVHIGAGNGRWGIIDRSRHLARPKMFSTEPDKISGLPTKFRWSVFPQ